MNAPSVDLKTVLVNAGVGTFGTDLFVGKEPRNPDNCVTLKDTGGFPAGRHAYYKPTVQVLIRNREYPTGYAKAQAVFLALHELTNQTVSGTRYIQVLAMGDVIYVGEDEQHRSLFTVNFEVHRTA